MKTIEITIRQIIDRVYLIPDVEPALSKATLHLSINKSEKDLKKYLKRTKQVDTKVICIKEIPYLQRKKQS